MKSLHILTFFCLLFLIPVTQADVTKKTSAHVPVMPGKLDVNATFEFYPSAETPDIPKGSFKMAGTFNEGDRQIDFKGVKWIKKPANYEMIPLKGKISDDKSFLEGTIDFPGCEKFTLYRTSISEGSILAGKWKGDYKCSQGTTGLTLTIE